MAEVASRTTSRPVCGRTSARIFEKYRGGKQRWRSSGGKRVGAEKRSGGGRPIRGVVTSRYCLGSGEQKCSKAKHGAIRRGRRDRAKRKHKGCKKQEKPKRQGIRTVGTEGHCVKRLLFWSVCHNRKVVYRH